MDNCTSGIVNDEIPVEITLEKDAEEAQDTKELSHLSHLSQTGDPKPSQ